MPAPGSELDRAELLDRECGRGHGPEHIRSSCSSNAGSVADSPNDRSSSRASASTLAPMLPVASARALSRAFAVAVRLVDAARSPPPPRRLAAVRSAQCWIGPTTGRSRCGQRKRARAGTRLRRTLGARRSCNRIPPPAPLGSSRGSTASSRRRPRAMPRVDRARLRARPRGRVRARRGRCREPATRRARSQDPTARPSRPGSSASAGLSTSTAVCSRPSTAGGRLLNVRGGAVPMLHEHARDLGVSAASAYATALPGARRGPGRPPRLGDAGSARRVRAAAAAPRSSRYRRRRRRPRRLAAARPGSAHRRSTTRSSTPAPEGVAARASTASAFAARSATSTSTRGPRTATPTPVDIPAAWLDRGAQTLRGPLRPCRSSTSTTGSRWRRPLRRSG